MNTRWLPGGARSSITFDLDGTGPQAPVLVIGGAAVGSSTQKTLVTWDGTRFESFGNGVSISGSNASIDALAVYNGQLIAAGSFNSINGVAASSIARWNGTSWLPLGAGVQGAIKALAVFQGELIAGGSFMSAGGAPANRLARWNGSIWQPVDLGLNDFVNALKVWNNQLVIGGAFTMAGSGAANRIATWDGAAFGTYGVAMSHTALPVQVAALEIYNGDLIAGGNFPLAGAANANFIARFDGTDWYDMGGGITPPTLGQGLVRTLTPHQGDLIVGGSFGAAGGVATDCVARWNGSSWQSMDMGIGPDVRTLAVFNSELYAGGMVASQYTGPSGMRPLVRFDGTHWNALGTDVNNTVFALNVYNGELVAGGWIAGIGANEYNRVVARWNGETWGTLGLGVNDRIDVLGVHNGTLYAGGGFTQTAEGVPAIGLVGWNGSTWLPVGGGLNGAAPALTTYNGNLIAGGYFTTAGGGAANRIARWDGVAWQTLGTGMNGAVFALAVYNGQLIAGGSFTTTGGTTANGLALWDGTNWQPLGTSLSNSTYATIPSTVTALAVYGGELIVAGSFVTAGGTAAMHVARWNGTTWQPMGNGQPFAPSAFGHFGGELIAGGSGPLLRWNGSIWNTIGVGPGNAKALTVYEGQLIAGGGFTTVGGIATPYLASWSSPLPLLSVSQPQGAGTPVEVASRRLVPGHEYFNFVTLDLAAGGVGTGPLGGLSANSAPFLIWQASLPCGTAPFHFISSTSEVKFGPYPLAPGLTFDSICVDMTDGVLGCMAPATRHTVQ